MRPHMTIAVPVRKRGKSIETPSSSKQRCLNSTTETATVVVKDENELDVTNAAKLKHLSQMAVVGQEALLGTVTMVYCTYNENSWSLHNRHELWDSENLV